MKTPLEIEKMHQAGKILSSIHREIAKRIRPGVTTWEINQFVENYLSRHQATPEQKGYMGYPYATCCSINEEVCHGFPRKTPLQEGDIVTIDLVVNRDGWLADSAWSYAVGNISPRAEQLLSVTRQSLYEGITQAKIGNRIGDISNAIQTFAEKHGFSVVRPLIGHGIGQRMHEKPDVPHFGPPGKGPLIREGMVFTIEPMLNMGNHHVEMLPDGWTIVTADGTLSAQYEHTIAITKEGPLVLTDQGSGS